MWFVLQNYGGIEVRENKKRTKNKANCRTCVLFLIFMELLSDAKITNFVQGYFIRSKAKGRMLKRRWKENKACQISQKKQTFSKLCFLVASVLRFTLFTLLPNICESLLWIELNSFLQILKAAAIEKVSLENMLQHAFCTSFFFFSFYLFFFLNSP